MDSRWSPWIWESTKPPTDAPATLLAGWLRYYRRVGWHGQWQRRAGYRERGPRCSTWPRKHKEIVVRLQQEHTKGWVRTRSATAIRVSSEVATVALIAEKMRWSSSYLILKAWRLRCDLSQGRRFGSMLRFRIKEGSQDGIRSDKGPLETTSCSCGAADEDMSNRQGINV